MVGPQIIGWEKNSPMNDGFHGSSEKIVSDYKESKEMKDIMKRTTALITLTNLQVPTKSTIF